MNRREAVREVVPPRERFVGLRQSTPREEYELPLRPEPIHDLQASDDVAASSSWSDRRAFSHHCEVQEWQFWVPMSQVL